MDSDAIYCTVLIEIVAAIVAIWQAIIQFTNLTTRCEGFYFLGIILMFIGVALLILALAGYGGQDIVYASTVCCLLLVGALLAIGIFEMAVSSEGGAKLVPWRTYKKYEVGSYSEWMQNTIRANWDESCKKAVVRNKEFVCARYDHDDTRYKSRANPAFMSGCCEAPKGCVLCSLNHTTSQGQTKLQDDYFCDDDCKRWDDDPNTLCFDCESCKAGFLEDLTKFWFGTGMILVFFGVILIWFPISSLIIEHEHDLFGDNHYTPLA